MSTTESTTPRLEPQPLPGNFVSVQPGGGVCYHIESAWGWLRRWRLKRFRPGYVRRMAALRRGDAAGAPHEILDPRDLKYCRNRCRCDWDPADDPFRWRDRLPLARGDWRFNYGLAAAGGHLLAADTYWYLALWLCCCASSIRPRSAVLQPVPDCWFAADGSRESLACHDSSSAVRRADRHLLSIQRLNRAPAESRDCLACLGPVSTPESKNSKQTWIGLEEVRAASAVDHPADIGRIARRIVCGLRPGEVLVRGQKFGMIKFGSRTELIVPDNNDLTIEIQLGQRILAGATVMARYGAKPQAADLQSLIPNP